MSKELTSFQKKRLENIKRNNDLLKKLNLNKIIDLPPEDRGNHVEKPRKKSPTVNKTNKRVKKEKPVPIPTRRSRRLQGQAAEVDNKESEKVLDANLEPKRDNSRTQWEEVKIVGDIKLTDLIKDENELNKLNSLKLSSGDFFNELREYQKQNTDNVKTEDGGNSADDELENELNQLEMIEAKTIYDRISSLYVHPNKETKIVIAGDISGNIGIWNVNYEEQYSTDNYDVDDDITRFQLFQKNISKIDCFPTKSDTLLAASYDGVIRSVNLNSSLESEEIVMLRNEYNDALGISDCQFSYMDPNVLFVSTLSGEFLQLDTRENNHNVNLMRLSDKKIGSMAINPQEPFHIATGSLDRTLKIWDIRKTVTNPSWSQYDDFPSHEIVATYPSRLSVSAVSFSPNDNTLVCNGYDDSIRLFNLGNIVKKEDDNEEGAELVPDLTIKHNCQSGRWTSILKARFKPNKNIFAIANMSRAIDIYTSQGRQLAHMTTPTVPAVVSWHPSQNWIAGGNSSGKVFLFAQPPLVKEEAS